MPHCSPVWWVFVQSSLCAFPLVEPQDVVLTAPSVFTGLNYMAKHRFTTLFLLFEKLRLTLNIYHKIHPPWPGFKSFLKVFVEKKMSLKVFRKSLFVLFCEIHPPLELYMVESCKITIIEQLYIYIITTSHNNIHS